MRGTERRAAGVVLVAAAVLAVIAAASVPAAEAHPCVRGGELWFRSADGTKLVGHRFGGRRPGGRTAVVLAHMSEGDLCSWVPYARRLAAQGFFAFPLDLRGHGFSEGRRNHRRAAADVAAAVRAVRGLGARKVVVVGASLGGIAGVIAAANVRPLVDGVAAISAPASISGTLDAMPAARRLQVPALYVAAEADQSPPYDFAADARTLHAATASSAKRVEVLPGSSHGTLLVSGSSAARALLERFLRDPGGTARGS